MTDAPQRNAYVDRLRGASILIVLVAHSLRYLPQWGALVPSWTVPHFVNSAVYGVTMFFVVSGYLITSKFVTRGQDRLSVDLRSFYIQRIGRIAPPLLLLLAVSLPIGLLLGDSLDGRSALEAVFDLAQLDLVAASRLMPHLVSPLSVLWSLRAEEVFYIFLPLLILLLPRRRSTALALVGPALLAIAYAWEGGRKIRDVFATFDQLAVGVLVACYADTLRHQLPPGALPVLRRAAMAAMAVLYFATDPVTNPLWPALAAVVTGFYLVGAVPAPAHRSAPPLRGLESLGTLSYEIYLFHMLVFWAMAPLGVLAGTTGYAGLLTLLLMILGIGGTCLLGLAIARLYSEPCNQLIRRGRTARPADTAPTGVIA